MRIASRIVACILALTGIAFLVFSVFGLLSGFAHKSVLEQSWPSGKLWTGALIFAAMGVGLLWGSRYFFTVDPATDDDPGPKPLSRFAPYLIARRRELKFIAQVGLVVSLIRFVSALFGMSWSNPWMNSALNFSWLPLFILGAMMQESGGKGMEFDWQTCAEPMRPIVKGMFWTIQSALLVITLFFILSGLRHYEGLSGPATLAFQPLVFAWEVLFFSYGRFAASR